MFSNHKSSKPWMSMDKFTFFAAAGAISKMRARQFGQSVLWSFIAHRTCKLFWQDPQVTTGLPFRKMSSSKHTAHSWSPEQDSLSRSSVIRELNVRRTGWREGDTGMVGAWWYSFGLLARCVVGVVVGTVDKLVNLWWLYEILRLGMITYWCKTSILKCVRCWML